MVVDQRHSTAIAVRRLEAFSRDGVPLKEPAELRGGIALVEHVVRIQEHGHSDVRLGQRRHELAQSAIAGGSLLLHRPYAVGPPTILQAIVSTAGCGRVVVAHRQYDVGEIRILR